MTLSFWTNEPSIIFNKDYILQIWPTQQMTFEEKLNAISRLIIIISILAFILTGNWNLIIIGFITLAIIFALYKLRKQQLVSSIVKQEGFATNKRKEQKASKTTTNPVTLETLLRTNFHPTTKQNPFGNVLLTDINDNPNRLAAAPSFNPDVYDEIDSAVKKQTQMLNPDIINTNKQLYGDLYDNYTLDNSMMRFYSTANSRVSNDQGAFAKWLYGTMPSGKESGPDGALARVQDNYQWINP